MKPSWTGWDWTPQKQERENFLLLEKVIQEIVHVQFYVIDTHFQIPVFFLPLVRQSFWGQQEQGFKTHERIPWNTILLKQPI